MVAPSTEFDAPASRMIFAGESALADGFALIGFEIYPDADVAQLDALLGDLLRSRQSAFLILDQQLAAGGSTLLPRVNADGGRIVVAVVPMLAQPDGLYLDIDDQIRTLLGGQSLDE